MPIIIHNQIQGGKLSVKTLKGLLKASYNPEDKVDNFEIDNDLSTKTTKVYYNPITKHVVVAHQGTNGLSDWYHNIVYTVGGTNLYKTTNRYKQAEKVQRNAEEKYGLNNLSTIGHSRGGLDSELLGKNGNEIITLNKATRPFSNHKHDNQYDIKTKNDLASSLNPFQKNNGNEIIIPSRSKSVLTEHSIDSIGRLNENTEIGKGLKNPWILHVKSISKGKGISYSDALKHPYTKKSYKKL